MHKARLLNVVRALRESPKPEAFDMRMYTHEGDGEHPCGTPACAMGHYAARRDLQDEFSIAPDGIGLAEGHRWSAFMEHFDIDIDEALELFDAEGCGDAETVEEAAAYIEEFVRRKEEENA